MRKLLLTIAVLSVIALPAAGCGGSDGAASGGSELSPAGSIVYGEATLKPEGDQKRAVDSILAKFPGGGQAGDKLKELIEKSANDIGAEDISFEKDVEPWLGDEIAFFVSGVGMAGDPEEVAVLVATDDEDAALAALEKTAEGEITRSTYRDVEYFKDQAEESNTGAAFDGYLVAGTERGVKAAIDASQGDSKLSDDDAYKNAIEKASEDRLALFYVNTPQFTKAVQQGTVSPIPDSFKRFFNEPFVATVDADEDGVVFEGNVPEELAKTFGFFGQGSELLAELPADSWLALAQTDFGKLLDFYVEAFAGAAGGREALEQQFRAATGLDLQKDVIDWMGDFGVFVRGTSVSALDGALVVETRDEAASKRFIDALERLARTQGQGDVQIGPLSAPGGGDGFTGTGPDVPKPVHVFQKDGLVVFAYGDAAANDAVDASDTLGNSPDFTSVSDSLGDYDVSLYVLMQPILELAESAGAGSEQGYQEAKPYLDAITGVMGGTSGDGDDLSSAVKVLVE